MTLSKYIPHAIAVCLLVALVNVTANIKKTIAQSGGRSASEDVASDTMRAPKSTRSSDDDTTRSP